MSKETFTPWDSAEFLNDDKVVIEYLQAALEENDPELFVKAVGNVARAMGMSSVCPGNSTRSSKPLQSIVRRTRSAHRHRDEGPWRTWCAAHRRAQSGLTFYARPMAHPPLWCATPPSMRPWSYRKSAMALPASTP